MGVVRSPPTWPPSAGTIIGARYEVTHLLGTGGMGCVCAARHVLLDEPVALKFLHVEVRNAESAARFFREAKAAASLRSEHVVRVIDFGTDPEVGPYLVMERLEGEDLAQRLERCGPFELGDAVWCILQACVALSHAHAAGIVHRDVKPSNIFAANARTGPSVIKV